MRKDFFSRWPEILSTLCLFKFIHSNKLLGESRYELMKLEKEAESLREQVTTHTQDDFWYFQRFPVLLSLQICLVSSHTLPLYAEV